MKHLTFLFLLSFIGCKNGANPPEVAKKPIDISMFDIYGFKLHNYSKRIYTLDIDGTRSFDDPSFKGTYCEVYDLSMEEKSAIVQQCKRQGYHVLPIGDIVFPFLKKYLSQEDSGYYANIHRGGEFFGLDRYLIVNLSKNYFIWFQHG